MATPRQYSADDLNGLADQDVAIYDLQLSQGASLTPLRTYTPRVIVNAHVKPLPSQEVMRLYALGVDITHKLRFPVDPQIDVSSRLKWRNTFLRPYGPAIDAHGLGDNWVVEATAMSIDNESVAYLD